MLRWASHRHDPLFSALQLDDRFIGDQDFWTAIAEHPTLINGPVLVLSGKARICKSPEDVQLFFDGGGGTTVPRKKTLSPRIAALIRGEPLAALPKVEAIALQPAPQPPNFSSIVQPTSEVLAKSKRKVAAKPRAAKAEKKKAVIKNSGKPIKKRKN